MQLTPIADLKVTQLRAICKRLKLSTAGNKPDLQATLRAHARLLNYRRTDDLKDYVVNTDNIDEEGEEEVESVASTVAPVTQSVPSAFPSVTSPAPVSTALFAYPALVTTTSSSVKPASQMTAMSLVEDVQRDRHTRTESIASLCGGTNVTSSTSRQNPFSTGSPQRSWIPSTENRILPTSAPFNSTKTSPPLTPPTTYAINSAGVNNARSRDNL